MKQARILWASSPSSSDRTFACPGWGGLTYYYRDVIRAPKESRYAKDGTAAHACLEASINGEEPPKKHKATLLDSELTERHSLAIDFAAEHIRKLIKKAKKDDKESVWFTERYLPIYPELGYSGTSDFCLQYGDTLHIVDYKHGVGVPVQADSQQLIGYLEGARRASCRPNDFARFRATVIQPRCPGKKKQVDTVEYTPAEFAELSARHYRAVRLHFQVLRVSQTSETPPSAQLLNRGDHCRYCPARPCCPEWQVPIAGVVEQFDRDTGQRGPGHPRAQGKALEQLLVDAEGIGPYLEDVRALVAIRYQKGEGEGLLVQVSGATRTFFKNDAMERLKRARKKKRVKKSVYRAMFRQGLVTLNQARQILPSDVLADLTYQKQDRSSLVPNGPSTDALQTQMNRVFKRHGEESEES